MYGKCNGWMERKKRVVPGEVCAECAERRNHSRKAVLNTQKSAEAIVPWGNSREGRNQYKPE